ncbi:alcohol dehydrogenase catalytic domain-containing protein [Streptococcus dentiloxodontae]
MKAVYLQETGAPSTIIIDDLPIPRVIPKSVLIKVEAASINYVDTFIRSGLYQTDLPKPYILGRDAIGQVVEVGEAVTKFNIGDTVWTNSMGYDGRQGITSEYALIPEERLFPAPQTISPLKLIAAVHSAATAAIILKDVLRVHKQEKILIGGAAGHVGSKLVYLAKKRGAEVVTTSRTEDFSKLKSLGSSACFNYHDQKLYKKLKSLHPSGFNHVIDTSGKMPLQMSCGLLALGGVIGLVTAPKNSSFDSRAFYMNCQQIKGFVISHANLKQLQEAGTILNDAFERGQLLEEDMVIKKFDEAAEAHQLMEDKKEKRKIILVP